AVCIAVATAIAPRLAQGQSFSIEHALGIPAPSENVLPHRYLRLAAGDDGYVASWLADRSSNIKWVDGSLLAARLGREGLLLTRNDLFVSVSRVGEEAALSSARWGFVAVYLGYSSNSIVVSRLDHDGNLVSAPPIALAQDANVNPPPTVSCSDAD